MPSHASLARIVRAFRIASYDALNAERQKVEALLKRHGIDKGAWISSKGGKKTLLMDFDRFEEEALDAAASLLKKEGYKIEVGSETLIIYI